VSTTVDGMLLSLVSFRLYARRSTTNICSSVCIAMCTTYAKQDSGMVNDEMQELYSMCYDTSGRNISCNAAIVGESALRDHVQTVSVRTVVRKYAGASLDELLATTCSLSLLLLVVLLTNSSSSRDHNRISTCSSLSRDVHNVHST
jgi:hypothetical protein